jgi:hypothetical protein
MIIPLFTAEASLYKHGGNYRAIGWSDRAGGIFPQLACDDDCLESCDNACPYPGEGVSAKGIAACRRNCFRICCRQ